MNIRDLKIFLEEIVHTNLYISSSLNKDLQNNLRKIKKHLKESSSVIEDIRFLISSRTNENACAYDVYIKEFLINISTNLKLDILYNQEKYTDIIKDDQIYICIWNSLKLKDKLHFLENKNKYTYIDILLINESVKEHGSFKDNIILTEMLNNDLIHKKIEPYSITLNYSYPLLSLINLSDFDMCNILTKESYTQLLLKKCKCFDDFLLIYEDNKKIFNLLQTNSLVFGSSDNENIYKFILDNPIFIGKFNHKYLDLFSILEITNFSKIKNLDSDAYSTILQRLFIYNKEDAINIFSEDNLKKCSKHSITVYPFDYMSETEQEKIFKNYSLFNKFIDTIMIEAINDKFSEEEIVNILRNDNFINDTSSYAIELLINKLSFKAAFNMLQRKTILHKINNLHVKVDSNDIIFLKGFLDSPILSYKSEHNMIYEMLNLLDKDSVYYYICLPYIVDNLSNYEIINLVINKKINIKEIINCSEIRYKLNTTDLVNLIERYFERTIDLEIFANRSLCMELFNITDEQFDMINFNEVNYLFETIRMKSLLSKQISKITILSYKSVLTSYLILGLDNTLKLVNDGNKDITLDEIKKLQSEIVSEKLLLFKENNSSIFQNMSKKIINNLKEFDKDISITSFVKAIKNNTYLDNLIYLMLENDFDSYNGIIEKLWGFIRYSQYDEFFSKKDIYDYAKRFSTIYLENQIKIYNKDFEKNILINFKPKENIIYKKRKKIGQEFINKLKLKLFVRALTDPNKDSYKIFFRDNFLLNEIKTKYIKYLANDDVDFESILEHVLTPMANERFDKENCLNKLGIIKPKNTDDYIKYLEDLKCVTLLNIEVEQFKEKYSVEQIISIMNYICYGTNLIFKTNRKIINDFDKIALLVKNVDGEIYVDKSALKFIYKDNLDIYNIEEIIEYINYVEILDDIVSKTLNYINRHMINNNIKSFYSDDYLKAINVEDFSFPITTKYYEPIKRVLSLKDMEVIFNGYDLRTFKKIDNSLKRFLFDEKNLIMVVDGYYNGIVDNLGIIISKWDKIVEYLKRINKDLIDISLITIENVLTLINFEDNVLGKAINKNIIKSIYEDSYYEVHDLNKRINYLIDLYKDSFRRVTSSVPYLCYKDDIYKVEVLDNYKVDILNSINGSLYKVGAIGNDFLHYSILNKNGIQIGIYKDNILVAKVLGVRNGNTIYLNALEGEQNPVYENLLQMFGNELIRITKSDLEPIEYVTIVNNDIYHSDNGLKLDTTICPVINNPINKIYLDFEVFIDNKNLLNIDEIYTNYQDSISTLLASGNVVDKNNFKYYDPEDKYYRKRNNVIKLSNNIGEEYLNRIETIIYLCKLENNSNYIEDIDLSIMDTIFLGDDYVIFITNNDNVIKFILPYDDRAYKEVEMTLNLIEKDYII